MRAPRCTTAHIPHPAGDIVAHQPTTGVLLQAVLDAVELSVLDGEHQLPLLLSVRRSGPAPQQPALHVRSLPVGTHPADGFATFTAPDDWFAAGCVAEGTATSMTTGEPAGRTTVAFLLHRDGTSVLSMSGRQRQVARESQQAPVGLVPDTCRRVLGLSTPEPSESVDAWLAALWLEGVFAAVVADPAGPWTWDRLRSCRPRSAWDFMAGFSWEELRQEFTRFRNSLFGVDAELAAWMDAGMFSRALVEAIPSAATLVDELAALLPAPVHAELRASLAGPDGDPELRRWRGGSSR